MGIIGIPTPYAAPNANAHIERWFLSLRVEALNHFIFLSREHIRRVVTEYVPGVNHISPRTSVIVGAPRSSGKEDDHDVTLREMN
jgi:hypothetical protein